MNDTLSAKDRIKRAGPTTRTVPVWLGADLDLLDQHNAVAAELAAAKKPSDSLAGNGPTGEIQQRLDDLRAQLDECRMDFRLRGLDDLRWGRLVAAHPPRKDGDAVNAEDLARGWDVTTFPAALIRAAVISPDLDDEDWARLLGDDDTQGVLTDAQQDDLAAEAFKLSKHPVDIPFSRAASPTTRLSEGE